MGTSLFRAQAAVLSVSASGASDQELEAIRLAIGDLWPELTVGIDSDQVVSDSSLWRFSGRWWQDDEGQFLPGRWPYVRGAFVQSGPAAVNNPGSRSR